MRRDEAERVRAAERKSERLRLVDALAQLSFAVQGALGEIAAEHELSIVQTRLLGVLRDRSPGMNALARYLGLDKSSVTGLVDRAERRGLVRRRPSSEDGRGVEVCITAAGRRLAERSAIEFEQRVAALVAPLEEAEQRVLSELASRILVVDAKGRGVDIVASEADDKDTDRG